MSTIIRLPMIMALCLVILSLTADAVLVPHSAKLHRRLTFVAKAPPANWASDSLEDYQTYHFRYLALGCNLVKGQAFFDTCCHPRLKTENLKDIPLECNLDAESMVKSLMIIKSSDVTGNLTTGQEGKAVFIRNGTIRAIESTVDGCNSSQLPTAEQAAHLSEISRQLELMSNSSYLANMTQAMNLTMNSTDYVHLAQFLNSNLTGMANFSGMANITRFLPANFTRLFNSSIPLYANVTACKAVKLTSSNHTNSSQTLHVPKQQPIVETTVQPPVAPVQLQTAPVDRQAKVDSSAADAAAAQAVADAKAKADAAAQKQRDADAKAKSDAEFKASSEQAKSDADAKAKSDAAAKAASEAEAKAAAKAAADAQSASQAQAAADAKAASQAQAAADAKAASQAQAAADAKAASQAQAEADAQAAADAKAAAAAKAAADAKAAAAQQAAEAPKPAQSLVSSATQAVGNVLSGVSHVYGSDGDAKGTYFYQEGGTGACGTANSDSTPLVALPPGLYADGAHCGKNVMIMNTANGKSVTAKVQDMCPGCPSDTSLDMSTGAYDAIGAQATGVLPIQWGFIQS